MTTSRWRQAAALGGFGVLAAVTAWWGYRPEEAPEAGNPSLAAPAYSLRSAILEETGPDGRWRLRIETDNASESAPGSGEIALQGVHALYHPGSPEACGPVQKTPKTIPVAGPFQEASLYCQ